MQLTYPSLRPAPDVANPEAILCQIGGYPASRCNDHQGPVLPMVLKVIIAALLQVSGCRCLGRE